MTTTVSMGARLTELAARHPDRVAIIFHSADGARTEVTYADLERRSNQLARRLRDLGVGPSSMLLVGLPDEPLHVAATFAGWKLGACILPISPKLSVRERDLLLTTAREFLEPFTVGRWSDGPPDLDVGGLSDLDGVDPSPVADIVAQPGQAIGSGGTSGRPKIIVNDGPAVVPIGDDGQVIQAALLVAMAVRPGQRRLICTPMYHTNGFGLMAGGLAMGDTMVLFEKFDAAAIVDAIERDRINQFIVVPVVLQRLAQVPGIEDRDLSSLEAVGYGGAPCPDWVTRKWIDLIGPTRLFHGFGASEGVGKAVLRGDEWLEHPGSCGRPLGAEVKILDDDGNELPAGEVGEMFMRPEGATAPAFRYLGADYRHVTADGFVSLGDFAKVDEDGYLYIVDRRTDMIISGGANVYPAEVEDALHDHPEVVDVAVIGLPDDTWGQRVHAVVQHRTPAALTERELAAWARERLVPYKVPKTWEFVDTLPRTEVGKVSRRQLVDERTLDVGTAVRV